MTSIARRATPAQAMIMKMVKGAVVNAMDSHPGWPCDPRLATSIAKRAAGTLTAQWPDVLAAEKRPSETADARPTSAPLPGTSDPATRPGEGAASSMTRRRASLRYLHNAVGALAGHAQHAGQYERQRALVDVLRMIAALENEMPPVK